MRQKRVKKVKQQEISVEKEEHEEQLEQIKVIPITEGQKRLLYSIYHNDIIICTGPAGVGKTHQAVGAAAQRLINKEIKKIIITRPAIHEGKGLGFLPGDISSKMAPFLIPIYDELKEFISPSKLTKMVGMANYNSDAQIEIVPLEYMRGRTIKHSFILIDEAQNATYSQLKNVLTRIGVGSKIIINGDPTQCDLPGGKVDLIDIKDNLKNMDRVAIVELTDKDIVRHSIISELLRRL